MTACEQALGLYRRIADQTGIADAHILLAVISRQSAGPGPTAQQHAEAAQRAAEQTDDKHLIGRSLGTLSSVLPGQERAEVARRAAGLLADAGDHRWVAIVLNNHAYAALTEDWITEAHDTLRPALAAAERVSLPDLRVAVLGNLGLAHLFGGDRQRAQQAFQAMLELSGEGWFQMEVGEALAGVAALLVGHDSQAAARLIGAAAATRSPAQGDGTIHERINRDFIAPARDQSDTAAWERAVGHGRTFTYEQAINYALSQLASTVPSPPATLHFFPRTCR